MSDTQQRTWWQWGAHLARRAWFMEWRGYQAIWRFVARRPRVPAGARAFTYHDPVFAVMCVIVGVSVLEVVLFEVLFRNFAVLRIILFIIGIWGLVWALGYMFGMLTRPHSVGTQGIRARQGPETDIALDWAIVASVARHRRTRNEKEPDITTEDGGDVLHLRIADTTNIDIELDEPTTMRLPRGEVAVRTVAIWADDPKGFLVAAKEFAAAPR